jgi:hypothetical protein
MIRVALAGAPGEVVTLLAYDSVSGALLAPATVEIGGDGAAQAMLAR